MEERGRDKLNKIKIQKYEFLIALLYTFNYISGGLLYFINILRKKTNKAKNKLIIYNKEESSFKILNINDYDDLIANKNKLKIIIILFLISILMFLMIFEDEFYDYDK